jgi:hypothetical protein
MLQQAQVWLIMIWLIMAEPDQELCGMAAGLGHGFLGCRCNDEMIFATRRGSILFVPKSHVGEM